MTGGGGRILSPCRVSWLTAIRARAAVAAVRALALRVAADCVEHGEAER